MAPLQPELSPIAALTSHDQVSDLVARLHQTIGEPPQVGGATRRGGAYVAGGESCMVTEMVQGAGCTVDVVTL